MQGNLISLIICGQHIVQDYDCHFFANIFRWDGIFVVGVGNQAVFFYLAVVEFVDDIFAFEWG